MKFEKPDKNSLALIAIIILVGTGSFGLGRLSLLEEAKAREGVEIIVPELADLDIDESQFSFVASKSGTRYYPIGCKSANRIKAENRVYFTNREEAESSGLTPAATC